MGFGDSTAKKGRSRHARMVVASVMAMTCGRVDYINAAEIAHPISNVEQRDARAERSRLRLDPARRIAASDSTSSPIEPTMLHVNPRTGNDQTGDGSLAQPFQTITHALDRARSNTIVVLAPGRYSETSGEQFPIQLRSGVTVYGEPDRRGDGIEIVGGGWLMTPTAGEQSVTILGFDGAGLSGVTVRNPDGSAIWVAGGMPWIVGNTIVDNARHGIVAHDGTPYIFNNRFDDNDGSDLEFSDRATPQLQDNQLDRRNDQSIGYFAIEAEPAIVAATPPTSLRDAGSTTPAPRRLDAQPPLQPRPQSQPSEIVAWQAETSFPPIVTPSDSLAGRAPAQLDPTMARSLPLDPDLAAPIENRANSVRSSGNTGNTGSFETEVLSIAPSPPARTSVRRLPAAPSVPTVSPVTNSVASSRPSEADLAASSTNSISSANSANSTNSTAPIVAWGTPTSSATDFTNTAAASRSTATTSGTPTTLLRWDALERSTPIASSELPPPIVNPAATSSNPIARPDSNIIASETAMSRPAPVPIRASIEPLDRANLPLAYAPNNVSPTWPQPRPTSIPGLIPLPVPDPNPPIGEGGALPPPPSISASLDNIPPGLSLSSAPQQVRYRVLVDTSVGLERVRAIAGSAFTTQIDGREAIQAGVFRDRWRADQLVGDLQADGLTAWTAEF